MIALHRDGSLAGHAWPNAPGPLCVPSEVVDPSPSLADLHRAVRRLVGDVDELVPLTPGQMGEVYRTSAAQGDLVIRVGPSAAGYRKDAAAHRLFAPTGVPVPRVVAIGTERGYAIAVSEFREGRPFNLLDESAQIRLLPDLLAIHERIAAAAVEGDNCGPWGSPGRIVAPTWREWVRRSLEEIIEGCPIRQEAPVWEHVAATALTLLGDPICRLPYHGDYGFDNLLATDAGITAVIDWSEAGYGDPDYDIGWLSFWWRSDPPMRRRMHKLIGLGVDEERGRRISAYELMIACSAFSHFAHRGNDERYRWCRRQCDQVLAEAGA